MKSILVSILVVFSFNALAREGGEGGSVRVGNGNGDGAFALQDLARGNPDLTPAQVLLKAYMESTVPADPKELISKSPYKVNMQYAGINSLTAQYGLFRFGSFGGDLDAGSLLRAVPRPALVNIETSIRTEESSVDALHTFNTRAIQDSTDLVLTSFDGDKIMSLRKYAENVFVGVTHYHGSEKDAKCLEFSLPQFEYRNGDDHGGVLDKDICDVFYIWTK